MAGLAVVIDRSGRPVAPELVARLHRSLAHRGPDGMSQHTEGSWAAIHAVVDTASFPPSEPQPYRHPGGTWYVADVRIDDRAGVVARLGGASWASASDIALLAEIHQRWGTAGVADLVGDFAVVAIRPDRSITCFRDHMGVKPLYYWCSDRWIVIGSELRQVAAHPEAPAALDLRLVGQYLSGFVEDPADTVIAGVRRLPAAHQLDVSGPCGRPGPRVTRYWTPQLDEPLVLASESAYREQFRQLLTEAVRCRLPADRPVATHLSGGLDSTSATLLAAHLRGADNVRAYSLLFPDSPGSDEQPFIDLAAEAGGLTWEPVIDDPGRARWVGDEIAFWSDIPLPPDGPNHVELGRRARQAGCRVVLSGHGGDNWLETSHLVVTELLQRRRLGAAWNQARWLHGPAPLPTVAALARAGADPRRPRWLRRPGRHRAPWVAGAPRVAAELDRRPTPGRLPRQFRSLAAQLRFEAETGGHEAMVREVLDRIGARAGVEIRHPYLDRRLMEFACRIPAEVHTTPGRNRRLQRDGLADLLPPGIAERTSKASFRALWYREISRHLPADAMAQTSLARLGWIDPSGALAAYDKTERAVARRSGGGHAFGLWGLVQVEALLQSGRLPS